MKIYLAGENGKKRIINAIREGYQGIISYLGSTDDNIFSGGVSGNLKPAYKSMAESGDISQKGFIKALQDESFWRGGSQDIGYKM